MTDHYRYSTAWYEDSNPRFWLDRFVCVKETEHGYWVVPDWQKSYNPEFQERRWVSKTSRKRHCYPTRELAWESYCIRVRRRLSYLERDLAAAQVAAEAVSLMQGPPPDLTYDDPLF